MNKILIPLLILLWSLLYSWFWNCSDARKPKCNANEEMAIESYSLANTQTTAETATDPVLSEAEQEELLFTPIDVYFEVNKAGINRSTEVNLFLETAKAYLAAHPDKKLSIAGHTDSDGSEAANLDLSEKRANEMRDLLIAEGFKGDQLQTSGKGEAEPLAPNDSPENKAKNRRVNVRLIK